MRPALAVSTAVVLLLGACGGTGRPSPAASTASSTPATTSTTSASSARYPALPDGPIEPGRYVFHRIAAPHLRGVALQVQPGFVGFDGVIALADEYTPTERFVAWWQVKSVFLDGCRAKTQKPVSDVDDLVKALTRQRHTRVTDPLPITLDHHDGVYVELTFSRKLDISSCSDSELDLFESGDGSRWTTTNAIGDDLWIFDIDGSLAILDVARGPEVTPAQTRVLHAMAESARFVEVS